MTLFLLIISALYALFTLTLWWTWLRMPITKPTASQADGPSITVIVPVRNEAANISALLGDLARQSYPAFDVIIADDASTDDTRLLVREAMFGFRHPLHLLSLTDKPTASPKKRAISQSIEQARGDLIVTTDGDCRVGPDWLATFAAAYQQTGAKLLSGPVTFTPERTLTDHLQTVEFASLIGSGATTMAMGRPTMCNGANLCYEKRVFMEVGGFAGVDHLASGDDELLMHKIARRYPKGVRFVKAASAIVQTGPHRSWGAFYQQRRRWASKWRAYESYGPTVLAVFIFLSNLAPVLVVAGWLLGFLNVSVLLLVVGLKALPEFLFLRQVLVFLQKKSSVRTIPITQLVYPFYVVFFGLAAQGKGYRWKGRKLE